MRRISIFGATGSIGQSTIDLIRREPNMFRVVALTGGRNVAQLAEDASALRAEIAVTAYEDLLGDLRDALSGSGIAVAAGPEALIEAAERQADWVMSAIVGADGLAPGLKALEHSGTLALANKESLVTAGPLLMQTAHEHGAIVLPVDSEHSAVFQALRGEDISAVETVTITASGGAFRDWPLEKLNDATLAEASSHPNWDMGQRITIDSASMFNKAMELIETQAFFGFEPEQIKTVIHPESLVHALVAFRDGALMAHMGTPDMRHAIGYALHWPERRELPIQRLNLAEIGSLTFREASEDRYPALALARHVMREGGLWGAAFTAAKDAALDAFIEGRIGFTDMPSVVADVIEKMSGDSLGNALINLENVRQANHLAQMRARESIEKRQR